MTTIEKLQCAERELNMRMKVYPKFIQAGKMTTERAKYECECMQSIVFDYRAQLERETQHTKLF